MREQDLQKVIEIEQLAYEFPWSIGIFVDCLRVRHVARVLEFDGLVVGYALMSMAAGEAHILNICINPDFRSRGWGRLLLDVLVATAEDNDVEVLLLEVRPSNTAALSLYASTGFNELGRRKGYYPAASGREDAIILARQLFRD